MKNTRFILKFILLNILVCFSVYNTAFASNVKNIYVNLYTNHPALDAALMGFKDQIRLSENENKVKYKINISNSQGNIASAVQIAKQHDASGADFLVAIGTPAAQTYLQSRKSNAYIAYTAVSDPIAANLVSHKNILGVTDTPPIKDLFILLKQLMPKAKKIGVLYNAGEINSVNSVMNLRTICDFLGYTLSEVVVNSSSEISTSLPKIASDVDVLYLPQDSVVVSAIANVVQIANKYSLPIIANDPSLVERGVFIGLGADYYHLGAQLAKMVNMISNGEIPNEHIQMPSSSQLKINEKVKLALNLYLPDSIYADSRYLK